MQKKFLDNINKVEDLKKLKPQQLPILCEEIRGFLLDSVSKTGGHLASNLGVIELTVALHYALNSPVDKFVFDVGHQCYTHKILTGRKNSFDTLRAFGGLSGFPKPSESEHDAFVAGHGNTAISVAIGLAWAKKLKGEKGQVFAIVGDGAFTGGMVYEGLNNISTLNNLVVILNDNEMSISKNVGAMTNYFTTLRTTPKYFKLKAMTEKTLDVIPLIGDPVKKLIQVGKQSFRRSLYKSTWFETLGFQYVGPIDGHDVERLVTLFLNLRHQTAPLFIYLATQKGKGYKPAEINPGEFHGVSSFNPENLKDPDDAQSKSFSTSFGETLNELARENKNICAITAAMKYGTGLQFFYRSFPERFFDVGMAEQHAVTFSAGLSAGGMSPVVCLYSTFLQRAYDQIVHDVMLTKENVLFAIDRAGLVPGDGETHQGVYDPVFLKELGVPTYSPCNYAELSYWLKTLLSDNKYPRALRYPRGEQAQILEQIGCSGNVYDWYQNEQKAKITFVSYGAQMEEVLLAMQDLKQENIVINACKLLQINPIPQKLVEELCEYEHIIFIEDTMQKGGIGEALCYELHNTKWTGAFHNKAIQTTNIPHGNIKQLRATLGLDAKALTKLAREILL